MGYSWTLGVGGGVWVKKIGVGSCRGTKKIGFGFSRFKTRFRKLWGRKREWEVDFFARLRRGVLLSRDVVFLYWNPRIEISFFCFFFGGGGGGGSGYKKNRGVVPAEQKKMATYAPYGG